MRLAKLWYGAIITAAVILLVYTTTANAYVSPGFDGYDQGREYNTTEYYKIGFKTNHLGNYETAIESYEIPSNEWLPIIDKSYFKTDTLSVSTEVDNTVPSAVYSAQGIVKVDVVFATGELSQSQAMQDYMDNFESQLQVATNNIDAYVEKVETSTVSTDDAGAEAIFATWDSKIMNYGLIGFQGNGSNGDWQLKNHQVTSNVSVRPGRAWLNPDYELEGDMKIHFRFGLNSSASDFGHGESGFMFRVAEDARSMYVIIIDNHDACGTVLYDGAIVFCKIVNGSLSQVYHKSIPMFAAGHNYSFDIDIVGNKMTISGDLNYSYDMSQDIASDPDLAKGSYGFYVWDQKNAYFDRISVTTGSMKSLGEAIQDVGWRDGSVRFVIHATDIIPLECDPANKNMEADYAYTVAKLLNANCYLINLGNNTNKKALDKLVAAIREADGTEKGVFYHNKNPNITSAMDKSANYIIEVAKKFNKPVDWVLVNTEIKWNTIYKDAEKDPPLNLGEHNGQNAQPQDISDIQLGIDYGLGEAGRTLEFDESKLLAEKWRYRHYNNFFDNSPVQVSYHLVWIEDPVSIFEYPGKYRINYKRRDNPLYPNISLEDAFDSYRYWSTDYDYKA